MAQKHNSWSPEFPGHGTTSAAQKPEALSAMNRHATSDSHKGALASGAYVPPDGMTVE